MPIKWIEKDRYVYEDAAAEIEYRLLSPAALGMGLMVTSLRPRSRRGTTAVVENADQLLQHIGREMVGLKRPSSLTIAWKGRIVFSWAYSEMRKEV